MVQNLASAAVAAIFAVSLVSCSGRGSIAAPPLPNIAGAWEFKAISNMNTNTFTGVEVALQEGQTIIHGVKQANGEVSASGATQIAIVSVDPVNATVAFGGNCSLTGNGGYDLSGNIQAFAGPFNFSFTENGNVFNVNGTLSADGQTFIGTYTSALNNTCADTGTISGTVVPKLAGTYVGQLTLPDGIGYSVTATLSENSASVLTVNLQSNSPDTVNFSLTGSITGNAFLIQGVYLQQQVTYEGYFGVPVTTNGQPVPGIYFVNATDSSQPLYAGTIVPFTP